MAANLSTLHQVVAVMQTRKANASRKLTELHHKLADATVTGFRRDYQPVDDDGEKLAPEVRKMQTSVKGELPGLIAELTSFFDTQFTQEAGNCIARADIIVGEGEQAVTLANDVPLAVLLFLEKQLKDLETFVGKLPTLPPDKTWERDSNKGCFVTKPEETRKTAKRPERFVKAEATDKHPAQVEILTRDELIGHWQTVHMSGALPVDEQMAMLQRVRDLAEGVKLARERANSVQVENKRIGRTLFDFIFPT